MVSYCKTKGSLWPPPGEPGGATKSNPAHDGLTSHSRGSIVILLNLRPQSFTAGDAACVVPA